MKKISHIQTSAVTRPLARGLRFAASVACLGLLASHVQAQTLITGFESSEGFTAGLAPSGQGTPAWEGSSGTAANTNLGISTAQAYAGTQSLAAVNGSGTSYFAVSPNLFNLGTTSASLYLTNPGTTWASNATIARFEIYYHDSFDTARGNNSRVVMTLNHGLEVTDNLRVQFSDNGVAGTVTRNLTASTVDLNTWNEVIIDFDFLSETKTVSVTMAGVSLNLPVDLAASANENSRISYIRLATNTGGTGTTYFDNITVIPEPGHISVLAGLAMLGLVVTRRYLKARK